MSKFDGSTDELSYGQALVEIVNRVSWPTEGHAIEVARAIQGEHKILPPEPDAPVYNDPRDATLVAQDAELAKLRQELAKRQADEAQAAKDKELEDLRAELAGKNTGKSDDKVTVKK